MKRMALTVALLINVFLASAHELTLSECVRLAREHYPAVANYGLLEKVSKLNLSNASKMWLPQGSVSAQVTWQNDVAALPEILTGILAQNGLNYPGLDKTQYKVGVDVNQQIWDGGRVSASKKALETAAEVERAGLDVQLYDLEGRVNEIYFSLLLFAERIIRVDKSVALVDSTLSQVKSMFDNGVATESDCCQIEAKLLGLQQQRVQLVATSDSFRRVLEILIGESIGNRMLVLPSESECGCDGYNHPQLRLFDSKISHYKAQELGVRSSAMPTVGAFVSGYYGYPGFDMFRNMRLREPSFNFMAGLKVSWNFGALYTRRNSLGKLRLQQSQVEADRATFIFNNSMAEKESLGQIDALRDVMRNDERILLLRQKVIKAATSQLRNGVIDATSLLAKITDVELAENDLALHRIELSKALYNLNHIRNK